MDHDHDLRPSYGRPDRGRERGAAAGRLVEDLKAGANALGRIAFGPDGQVLAHEERREMVRCRIRLLALAADLELGMADLESSGGRRGAMIRTWLVRQYGRPYEFQRWLNQMVQHRDVSDLTIHSVTEAIAGEASWLTVVVSFLDTSPMTSGDGCGHSPESWP